ncbi:MAG: MFS transporter [Candidatus Limnocylindrus sp.]
MPNVSPTTATARRRLVRDPGFLRLWSAETVSHLGSNISAFALPIVAIRLLDAGPFEVALLNLADFLPFLAIGLIAGAVVDRLPRRAVLVAGDLGRALLLTIIPLAYLLGALNLALLIGVGFCVGVLTVFFDVAYQSYLPALIPREDLVEGNSKLELSRNAAGLIGPGIAGAVIAALRAPVAIMLDAGSFLLSALLLLSIRTRNADAPAASGQKRAEATSRGSLRGEIAAGVRFVFGNPALRTIGAATATSNLFSTMANTLIFLFAIRELHMSEALIGLSFTIAGIGGLAAAAAADRVSKRLGVGKTILYMSPLAGPFLALVAIGQPDATVLNVALLAASGFTGIASGTIYNINQVSLRQAITPEPMQGRMNATMRWFVWGTIPIGALLGGVLGESIGVRATIALGGSLSTLAFVPLLFGPVPAVREMPTGVNDAQGLDATR